MISRIQKERSPYVVSNVSKRTYGGADGVNYRHTFWIRMSEGRRAYGRQYVGLSSGSWDCDTFAESWRACSRYSQCFSSQRIRRPNDFGGRCL